MRVGCCSLLWLVSVVRCLLFRVCCLLLIDDIHRWLLVVPVCCVLLSVV